MRVRTLGRHAVRLVAVAAFGVAATLGVSSAAIADESAQDPQEATGDSASEAPDENSTDATNWD